MNNFNTLSFKLKINKEIRVKLSHATVRLIYRIFYLTIIEYTFLSVVHVIFHTIDNILEYKVAYIIYTRIKKFFVFIRTED